MAAKKKWIPKPRELVYVVNGQGFVNEGRVVAAEEDDESGKPYTWLFDVRMRDRFGEFGFGADEEHMLGIVHALVPKNLQDMAADMLTEENYGEMFETEEEALLYAKEIFTCAGDARTYWFGVYLGDKLLEVRSTSRAEEFPDSGQFDSYFRLPEEEARSLVVRRVRIARH